MVRRRRVAGGLCVVALALASFLAPAAPALATSSGAGHQPASHHQARKKTPVPHDVVCKDVKAEQASQSHLGLALAMALESGHVDRAKRGMLHALDTDLRREGTASGALKGAPRKVQEAEKRLVGDVEKVKTAVSRSSSIKQLLEAFASLSRNTHLAVDGTTLANWFESQCAKPPFPVPVPPSRTPGSSLPGTPGETNGTGGTGGASGTSGTTGPP